MIQISPESVGTECGDQCSSSLRDSSCTMSDDCHGQHHSSSLCQSSRRKALSQSTSSHVPTL